MVLVPRLAALAVGAALLGLRAPAPASASCAGPGLSVTGVARTAVPRLVAGSRVEVTGVGFLDGCDDGVQVSTGGGCSSPREQREQVRLLTDVRLTLFEGPSAVPLGASDATGPEGGVRFDAVLPADLAPGPAVLEAAGARLTVEVVGPPRR